MALIIIWHFEIKRLASEELCLSKTVLSCQ